jgi:hypothetical protein
MSTGPSGDHTSSDGNGRRRWSTLLRLLAVAVLVAAGLYVAVRLPIPTPSEAPAAYAAEQTEQAALPAPAAPLPRSETPSPSDPTPGAVSTPGVTEPDNTGGPIATPLAPTDTGPRTPALAPPPPAPPPQSPCQPTRFTLSDLGIDASVVRLGLTPEGDLGTPRDADKKRAGWFPSVLAGSPRGTVLMDGHTYHDGSALFSMSFERQVRTGMVMTLSCPAGAVFRYRIAEVVLDLSPAGFTAFVEKRSLYAADGPAQLVMITCTDYDVARRVWAHRAVLVATPIT